LFAFVNERKLNMGTIATRVAEEVEEYITQVMKAEGLDKSSTIRKLLLKGIDQWRLERAIEGLKSGKVTISKAAEMAGITIYEMVEIVREKKIDYIHITRAELEEELAFLEGV